MEYKKIGDIIELHRGYDLPVEQMKIGNIPVVGSNGIVGYHNQERSISPTVTIGRSGSIGKVHFYEGFTWVHNTALYVNDFKNNNPLYIYYVLKNLNFENLKSSSVVPSLNRNYIYPLKVPFYINTVDQKKIAQTLLVIDQKIALNTRMNAELEAMAKQLYDYWFVQFDFPDKNGKPYKSSGGKMVWDDKLKRVIPEGWEVKTLEKIENIIVTGKTPSTSDDKNFNGDIPFITIDDIRNNLYINTTSRTLSFKGAELQRNKYIPENTLCCSCIGTPGIIGFTSKLSQTNQQINSIIFKNEKNREFIFFSLKMIFSLSTAKTGNILPNMNKNEFSNIILVYPSSEILSIFHEIVSPLFDKIKNNCSETCRLTHLRDSLLPMLMNGQVIIE